MTNPASPSISPRIAVALLLVLVAVPIRTEAQEVARVDVRPAAATVTAGEGFQFEAVAYDDAGGAVTDVPVVWVATPFDIAGSSEEGRITTFRPGQVYVLAIVGGVPGMAVLTITERPLDRLEIAALDGSNTVVDGLLRLEAQGFTEVGDPLPAVEPRWRSDRPEVAEVGPGGLVTGRREGRATVTAAAGDRRAEITVEVRPNPVRRIQIDPLPERVRAGDVVRLSARPLDAEEREVRDVPLRWSVGAAGANIHDGNRFVADRPGTYAVTASAGGVAASGLVRVAARNDPRRLEVVAHLPLPGEAQATEVWPVGDAVYVASLFSGGRLYVFDASDPAAPRLVDSLVVDARIVNDVKTTADGRIGVITREGASDRRNGLVFFDASDPFHPRVVSEYTTNLTGGVHTAWIDGHHAFATDDATGSLRIIDFSDPANPMEAARWEIPREVQAFDVLGLIEISPQRYLHDVFVADGLAYLAYWRDGLVILDIGNGVRGGSITDPQLVSRYRYSHPELYPEGFIAGTHAVFRYGDYVFVGDESYPGTADLEARSRFPTRGLLHVIDVSDIERPRRVAWWDPVEFGVHNLWVEDDVLYIGAYDGGVRVFDVSGELRGDLGLQGRQIDALHTGSLEGYRPNVALAWGAVPHRDHVFVSDINTGLWITRLAAGRLVP